MPIDPRSVAWDSPRGVTWDDEKSTFDSIRQMLVDTLAGGLRGAGSIGATLRAPVFGVDESGNVDPRIGSQLWRDERAKNVADQDAALKLAGADPTSLAFKGGKLGAEIAGTLGVGGALGKVAQAFGAAPSVVQALASSGMTTGSSPAGFLPRAADLALRSGAGGVAGGTSAMLVDPGSAGTGAAIGAALPPALLGLGAAGRLVGRGVTNTAAALSDAAAKSAAMQQVERGLGESAPDLAALRATGGTGAIPLSAAAQSGDLNLARLEHASRLRNPVGWREFDNTQAQAVWDKVQEAGSAASGLNAARTMRGQNWDENWRRAMSAFEPGATTTPSQLKAAAEWPSDVKRFSDQIDQALRSPPAADDAVERMLNSIKGKLERFGEDFSPAHLQKIRASLSGKAWEGAADPLKQVPRDNPMVVSVLRAVDDMLNKVTGGRWAAVTAGYAADSKAVDAARSAGRMMGNFVSPEGNILGSALTVDGSTIPAVTAARMERALNLARGNDRALMLTDEGKSAAADVVDALKAQQLVQQLKRSASAGGGSDTASNIMALAGTSKPGLLRELGQLAKEAATGRTDRALIGLLSSPEELAAALEGRAASPGLWPSLLDSGLLFGARASPILGASR